MSSLSLEKNGRISSSKRTKHIKAKYFLVKNYYDSGEIDLRYCPTDVMWADVLTKPLQGHKFRDMWAFLQNVQETMMTTLSFNLTSWLRDRWTNKPRLLLHRGSVLKNWQTFLMIPQWVALSFAHQFINYCKWKICKGSVDFESNRNRICLQAVTRCCY